MIKLMIHISLLILKFKLISRLYIKSLARKG